MPEIHFFNEEVLFRPNRPRSVKKWIQNVVSEEGSRVGSLNFIFCSDDYLHNINLQFLQHDTLTDIVTFDHSEEDGSIEGDIFISIDRVRENAGRLSIGFTTELHRVMIHGVLHLLGYKDKTAGQKLIMRKKEDTYLSLLDVPRGT
jgi:probable rRNA maturation factor